MVLKANGSRTDEREAAQTVSRRTRILGNHQGLVGFHVVAWIVGVGWLGHSCHRRNVDPGLFVLEREAHAAIQRLPEVCKIPCRQHPPNRPPAPPRPPPRTTGHRAPAGARGSRRSTAFSWPLVTCAEALGQLRTPSRDFRALFYVSWSKPSQSSSFPRDIRARSFSPASRSSTITVQAPAFPLVLPGSPVLRSASVPCT